MPPLCTWQLEDRQITLEFVLCCLGPVLIPFQHLVGDECVEDMVPQHLSDHLALLGRLEFRGHDTHFRIAGHQA